MAVTITKNLTDLWNSESIAGWTGMTTTLYSGFNREGTNCEGVQVSTATVQGYRTFTSINMTANNYKIYIWMVSFGQIDTYANGGYRIVVGDGTNRAAYYVGGSDYVPAFRSGIWICFMLDPNNLPTNFATLAGTEASINWGAITNIGVGWKTLSKSLGGADNCFVDIARYGTGITIGGGGSGTEGTWEEIATDDASTAAGKAYGIVMKYQTGVFGVQGQLNFGNAVVSSSYFKDYDATIVFMDTGAGSNFYQLNTIGNSTGTNFFSLGEILGSGDTALGARGCTILSAGPTLSINLNGSNTNTCNVYGSKFLNISDGITLPSNPSSKDFIGNTVDQSGQVVAGTANIRNCTFSATTDNLSDGSALLWNSSINMKNCAFNGNTDVTNNPHGIEHQSIGTFTYDGLTFSGNDYDLENTTAGLVTINAVNSNVSTYENTGGGSTVINNNKSCTVKILDQSGNPIPGVEVSIFQDNTSRTIVLASTPTDENGDVSTTVAASLGDIIIRARQSTDTMSFLTSESTTDGVNSTLEEISHPTPHNFQTGDAVTYSKNGGSASISASITDGNTYYVRAVDTTSVKLYASAANAIADTSAFNLTASGTETHSLDPIRFIPASATGTIGTSDFSTQITMITDNIATG